MALSICPVGDCEVMRDLQVYCGCVPAVRFA
jgi:hypothetical protein